MMGLPVGFLVEAAVAVLLALTIAYCMLLNHRLKKLHGDRELLGKMIADLVQATGLANAAVQELKGAAVEADETLNARLEEAERFELEFANHIAAGQQLMDKIAKITAAARRDPVVAAEMSGETNKAQSALAQLAMRPRIRGNAA
jgi:hypothetical protein